MLGRTQKISFFKKGWGQSAKLGTHSAICSKLGTALQAYTLNPIVIKATGPHISWMNWTCHSQLIWRLATQIYRNCHRTWLRHHNWWNGDESNFPTLSKNIEQRREVHRIGQQTSISAFLHLRNLMYGGVNQRFPSNGNLNERESQ